MAKDRTINFRADKEEFSEEELKNLARRAGAENPSIFLRNLLRSCKIMETPELKAINARGQELAS